MRAYIPDYELRAPRDLGGALELLAREPGAWRPFAGGTDLMVLFEAGLLAHKKFVSVWHFKELRGIEITSDNVTLGALTTYTDVQRDETLQREFPTLCHAARETGGWANHKPGHPPGNLAHHPPPPHPPPPLHSFRRATSHLLLLGAPW